MITNRQKYHIHMNIPVMINRKTLSFVIATITLVTTVTLGGATNIAYAQAPPPLESNTSTTDKDAAPSLGKATIPVSSGEQIIIDIPLKDGNTYKLVPIK